MRSQETTVLEVHEVAGLAKRSPEDTKNEVLTASLLGGGGWGGPHWSEPSGVRSSFVIHK